MRVKLTIITINNIQSFHSKDEILVFNCGSKLIFLIIWQPRFYLKSVILHMNIVSKRLICHHAIDELYRMYIPFAKSGEMVEI